jgi:hypothetical protein
MLVLRPYRNEDLELMPPRPCEREDVEAENEMFALRMTGPAFTLWEGDQPIAAGGLIIFRTGVAEAWARGSVAMARRPRTCARVARCALGVHMRERRLHRVQATVRLDNPVAIRFLLWLGFKCEGTLWALGEHGEHYLMMARVEEARTCRPETIP